MGRDPKHFEVLYTPDVDPRSRKHRCVNPERGELGSIVGCKDCGQLWYFRYRPDGWYNAGESRRFVKVRWYHFGLKRKLSGV